MQRWNTVNPPAAISFFTHNYETTLTVTTGASLKEQSIRSSFEGAQKELSRYQLFNSRWDGYSAEPFEANVLQGAASILSFSEAVFLDAGIVPTLVTTGPASDG